MIGTRAMLRLLRIADRLGMARVALVGDRHQLRAIEAGQPFRLLQRAGMPTARMTEVLRQRDPSLRTAVEHLIAERPGLAIAELGGSVLEVGSGPDPDAEMAETMADLWLALDADARSRTLLLAPTHALRAEVHGAIRRRLADEGVLRGPTLTLDRYVNLRLTRAQKRELVHYREGDVVVFHQRDYSVGAEAGDACHVLGTDEDRVLLDLPDGRVRRMRPDRRVRYRFELYETRPMELRVGDRIRWTRPHRGDGLELDNGARATVRAIARTQVRFRADDGTEYALARSDPQLHHLDHAYTSTVHGAQGMTADFVIAILRADQGPLVDLRTAYVEVSRARDDAVLLTDDREALGAALDQRSGEECSALEALGVELADPEADAAPARAPLPGPGVVPSPVIAERPRLLAEAVPWWEFAEAARARGEEPFAAAGRDAAIAPVLALAARAPDALPAGIARVADDYRVWCLRRQQERREAKEAKEAEARRLRQEHEQRLLRLASAARRLGAATRRLGALARNRLAAAERGLRDAAARRLPALARDRLTALQRVRDALERRIQMPFARCRHRADVHVLKLAERERQTLADWKQRRIDRVAAMSRTADREASAGSYEHLKAEGRRLAPRVRRPLQAEDRPDLPADIQAVRHNTRTIARTLASALLYDAEAAATVNRLRAHRQRAERDGVPWFSSERGAALCAEIDRLSDQAKSRGLAQLVVLPPTLAGARWELRRAARRLPAALRVVDRVSSIGTKRGDGLAAAHRDGSWFQASKTYESWRRKADTALRLAEKMLAAGARYQPLINARSALPSASGLVKDIRPPPPMMFVGWGGFGLDVRGLRRQLNRDDAIRELERTRRSLFARALLPGRRIPYYRKGYSDFIEELQKLGPTAPPGELPPVFSDILEENKTQATLHGTVSKFIENDLPRLTALPERCRALRHEWANTRTSLFDSDAHAIWLRDAQALSTAAQKLLDSPECKPHLQTVRGSARRIRKTLGPVRQPLVRDHETMAVLRDWRALKAQARQWSPPEPTAGQRNPGAPQRAPGRPPFFEDGYDALIERVRALHRKTRQKDEPVPEFDEALGEHETLAATRQQVDALLRRIRTGTEQRRKLLARAASDPSSFQSRDPEHHAAWEKLGAAAEQASGKLMAQTDRYGPHLHRDPQTWRDIRHSQFDTFASRNLGGLAAEYLLRLHDHGAACASKEIDPWMAPEFDALLQAMNKSLAFVRDPAKDREMEIPRYAVRSLRYIPSARRLADILRGIVRKRADLEGEAERSRREVVDLPGYDQWRDPANRNADDTRKLLDDPESALALEGWPEHAGELRERLPLVRSWQWSDDEILRARSWRQKQAGQKRQPAQQRSNRGGERSRRRPKKPSGGGPKQ